MNPKAIYLLPSKNNLWNFFKHLDRQLILIICSSYICKFTYLLKYICNLEINTSGFFTVISHIPYVFVCVLSWGQQDNSKPSCLSSVNSRSLWGLFISWSLIFVLFVDDFTILKDHTCSVKCCLVILSAKSCSVPYRDSIMWDEFRSGMS